MKLYLVLPETDLDHLDYIFANSKRQAIANAGLLTGLLLTEIEDYGYQAIEVPEKVKILWNTETVTLKEMAKLNNYKY